MSTGHILSPPAWPLSSGLNPALDARTFNFYPYTAGAASLGLLAGPRTLHVPSVPSYADEGAMLTSFGLDWFWRIHITPALMRLGNLVSGITKDAKVWNAWLDSPQQLNSIAGTGTSGIVMTPPGALPITFAPNQELDFPVAISLDGSPVIDAVYTFSFADGEKPQLEITGNRITAWAMSPDWQSPVEERIEFLTDVLPGWSGAEQRRALRIAPRRFFDFEVLLTGKERRFLEAQLFAWSSRVWALPIWPDGQMLQAPVTAGDSTISCDTVNRDFVAGGMAAMISDTATFEIVQILSVAAGAIALTNPAQGNWPAQTRFYPVRAARLASFPKLKRDSADIAGASASFQVIDACDWPAATGLPSYRSLPVFESSPAEGELEMTYSRNATTIDNATGQITVDDPSDIGMPTNSHDWFLYGRTARAAFRALLYRLKGRQAPIWIPTYQQDLALVASVTSVQTTLDVEYTGYTLYLAGQTNRQDIRIETQAGAVFYRRITGAEVLDAHSERVSLDASLGVNLAIIDIRRISYMVAGRLASDSIQIDHHTAADGLATARTPWQAFNSGA